MSNYSKTVDEYYEDFVSGRLDDFGSWGDNVRSWMNNKEKIRNGLLLIKYEDLRTDTINKLKTVVEFLSVNRSIEDVNTAIEWASLENMKKQEQIIGNKTNLFKDSNIDIPFVGSGQTAVNNASIYMSYFCKLENYYHDILSELDYI